jgi:hypothetical protein
MKSQVRKTVAGPGRPCIGFSHVRTLTQCAREEVPELLIKNQPVKAVTRPLAVNGSGAFLSEGAEVGPQGGVRVDRTLPRMRRRSLSAAWMAAAHVSDGYQPTSRIPFELKTQNPGTPGGVGPHPAREPEPV